MAPVEIRSAGAARTKRTSSTRPIRHPLLENLDPIFNGTTSAAPGGIGAVGGSGAEGGEGGDGGDGGDAAGAIWNAEGAVLHLQDVVFGGRLTSGFVLGGNDAEAGDGGQGGFGGWGGRAGGGRGGDSNLEWSSLEAAWWYSPEAAAEPDFVKTYLNVEVSQAGIGGNGGIGGDGGDAGATGDGGNAATILNFGSVDGNGAMSGITNTGNVFANEVIAGDGLAQGGGGLGGSANGGRGRRAVHSLLGRMEQACFSHPAMMGDYPDEFAAWYSDLR